MLIRIDPSSDQPLFAQIAASIRSEIVAGRLDVGARLPAAREVADSLDVNLHTVLRGYQTLRDEGLVELRRGRGAVVAEGASRLGDLRHDIEALTRRASSVGLSADTLVALVTESARRAEA